MSQRSQWSHQLYDYNHPQTVVDVSEKHEGKSGYYLTLNAVGLLWLCFPVCGVKNFPIFVSFGQLCAITRDGKTENCMLIRTQGSYASI